MPPADVLDAIRSGDAAGVALYRALNVSSPTQLRELGMAVQRAALEGGQPTAIVAIDQQDQPVIIGIVLLGTVAVVVANILVDIGYAILDPRVRLT